MKKILIVEDEKDLAENLRDLLEALGYVVVKVFDQAQFVLEYLETETVDLILMDVMIKGSMDGIELTEAIKKSHPIPVVFITAFSDQGVLERISKGKYEGYLLNPDCSYPSVSSCNLGISVFLSSSLCTTDFLFVNGWYLA